MYALVCEEQTIKISNCSFAVFIFDKNSIKSFLGILQSCQN